MSFRSANILSKRLSLFCLFAGAFFQAGATWSTSSNLNYIGAITPNGGLQNSSAGNQNGTVPYWTFSATAGSTYFFSFLSSGTTEDMMMSIFDGASPGGNMVAANDNYGASQLSAMTFVAPATQTYYILADLSLSGGSVFSGTGSVVLSYYACGATAPAATPVAENWSGANVITTSCSGWMAQGGGAEGDWFINTSPATFAYGANLAGGSGSELVFAGNQFDVYGVGTTESISMISYPINTNGTNSVVYSWKQTLEISSSCNPCGTPGSDNVVIKLQSSSDLINWNDEYVSPTYVVSNSAYYATFKTTQSVTINTSTNITTWIRFYLSAVPGKIVYWAIDDGNTGIVTLPIELGSFTGRKENEKTRLDWETLSETNNDYFTVERSGNGDDFTPIAKVKGAGNSSRALFYTAYDENPLSGINYYRLRQTDFNGAYKYSNPIEFTYTPKGISIGNAYPNPGDKEVGFNFTTEETDLIHMQLFDLAGRMISEEERKVIPGNNYLSISTASLASGIYSLKTFSEVSGIEKVSRLIITH